MENLMDKIAHLEETHNRIDPELVKRKNIKLGLRNTDGTGVVVGITSKGQVLGYEKDDSGEVRAVPGKLLYCGYDLEDLVAHADTEWRYGFEEVAYLLLTGELPNAEDLASFTRALSDRRALPQELKKVLRFNSKNDDQMCALHTAVSSLHKFDANPRTTDIRDVTRQCIDLIAKIPAIIAYNHLVCRSWRGTRSSFLEPESGMTTAQSFLTMLHGRAPSDKIAHAFDIALMLHAEHGGGNNSTFTVRTVSSSLTDTYMAICAGIASLAGHLHGGANEAVMNMMEHMKRGLRDWEDDDEISAYLRGLLDGRHGDRSGKIYGMGHAVYTISDPRVDILRKKATPFAEEAERMDELRLFERVARLAPPIIRERKSKIVCPNVDFFSGFLYDMLDIPQELFTPIFAMSRVVGWSSHRIEEIIQGRLIRPAYVSTREGIRPYVPLESR
ncbi:MAG TPA: citrate synthase [Dissulfurispiraceae bacterium]|nr:citrate synthase [Dissulfurispiraceae bacterium]